MGRRLLSPYPDMPIHSRAAGRSRPASLGSTLIRRAPRPDRRGAPGHGWTTSPDLVIANLGVEDSALCEEVCQRAGNSKTGVMIVAPVEASSSLRVLTDDFDTESGFARARVEKALGTLRERGVRASGHVGEDADPWRALLDGLREFPADEVVMLPGGDRLAASGDVRRAGPRRGGRTGHRGPRGRHGLSRLTHLPETRGVERGRPAARGEANEGPLYHAPRERGWDTVDDSPRSSW